MRRALAFPRKAWAVVVAAALVEMVMEAVVAGEGALLTGWEIKNKKGRKKGRKAVEMRVGSPNEAQASRKTFQKDARVSSEPRKKVRL